MQHQVFNHPVMKIMNQVVLMLVLLVMILLRPQLVVMMLLVVFLQSEMPVLIWSEVPVESHPVVMNHRHRIVQVVVLAAMLEAWNHHLVVLVLLTTSIVLVLVVVVVVAMNRIHHNKHFLNKIILKIFLQDK